MIFYTYEQVVNKGDSFRSRQSSLNSSIECLSQVFVFAFCYQYFTFTFSPRVIDCFLTNLSLSLSLPAFTSSFLLPIFHFFSLPGFMFSFFPIFHFHFLSKVSEFTFLLPTIHLHFLSQLLYLSFCYQSFTFTFSPRFHI